MAECTPSCDEVRRKCVVARPAFRAAEDAEAEFDRFLARIRRDAWDDCFHQVSTAPARGVVITPMGNPWAPERRTHLTITTEEPK